MAAFSWLHLTDLHFGLTGQGSLWPRLRQKFREDLAQLHDHSGPWDLVLFTGDLTHRGDPAEYQGISHLFGELWKQLARLGSQPKLLAVPGNHDLVRPVAGARLRTLVEWQPHTREQFWKSPRAPGRKIVDRAFRNYTDWWQAEPHRAAIRDGILPGDFSATVEKSGASLGVVGLNTTFLQLSGGDFAGKLALHVDQFHQACGGDGVAWAGKHNLCLLLTHQPPQWLNDESRVFLDSEINDPGQFAVHLCGHLHEAWYTVLAQGGGRARRVWQGRSLFGLEEYGSAHETRSHGYSVGVLGLDRDQARLTFWPRRAGKLADGSWNVAGDHSLLLEFTPPRTRPEIVPLLNPYLGFDAQVAEPRELIEIRRWFLMAESTAELRRLMWRAEDAVKVHGAPARLLVEQIQEALARERSLRGYTREEAIRLG